MSSRTENENYKMVTMYVTYSGDANAPFDRGCWIDSHLPLVRECWEPHGLVSVARFFPSGEGKGLVALVASPWLGPLSHSLAGGAETSPGDGRTFSTKSLLPLVLSVNGQRENLPRSAQASVRRTSRPRRRAPST